MTREAPDDDLRATRRRWLRFAVFGGFLGVAAAIVLPTVPREQNLRFHLGAGSTRVVSATACSATATAPTATVNRSYGNCSII